MTITFPPYADLSLTLSAEPDGTSSYPTASLQKGFLLSDRGQSLAEEAVGFGVPVLKYGLQALFPGSAKLDLLESGPLWKLNATFRLDRVERLARPGDAVLKSQAFYSAKDMTAAILRRFPAFRAPLTALSSTVRRLFGWKTTYQPAGFSAQVALTYTFEPGSGILQVRLQPESLRLLTATELILMNEQGARSFDHYEDSAGMCLTGKEVGCWDEVHAEQASFVSSARGVRFTLSRVPGARLVRGRELVGSRLAWAGFGYVIPLPVTAFEHSLRLERLP